MEWSVTRLRNYAMNVKFHFIGYYILINFNLHLTLFNPILTLTLNKRDLKIKIEIKFTIIITKFKDSTVVHFAPQKVSNRI